MEKDKYWESRISLQNSSNQEMINVDEMGHSDLNTPRVYARIPTEKV